VADLVHRSSRTVNQRPDVVHDRLMELATRLRDEAPSVPSGSQAATLLGTSGPLGIEIADRGPSRIELRTTQGRIRGEGAVDITGRPDGRTDVAMLAVVKPQGFAANMMLSVGLQARPGMQDEIEKGLERGFDELATELAKPDDEWDPASWMPSGIPG
jgi:hypothetical protein